MHPSLPANADAEVEVEAEAARLAALQRYGVLDTPPDPAFDDLAALAAAISGSPIAMVSLVDSGRQWFKARIGLTVSETPRQGSFCDHALRRPQEVMVVRDASADPRFVQHPQVVGPEHVRFYAAAPLVSPDGQALGTLCVLDHQPRDFSPAQAQALAMLSRQVMAQIELQHQRRELMETVAQRNADLAAQHLLREALAEREQRLARIAAQVPGMLYQFKISPEGRPSFSYSSEGIHSIYGISPEEALQGAEPVFERIHPEDLPGLMQSISESQDQLTLWDREYRVQIPGMAVKWVQGRAMPERLPDGTTVWHGVSTDITARKQADELLNERGTVLLQAQRLAKLGSWRWSSATRCSVWSEETCRLFGFKLAQNEVADEDFMQFVHPDDAERVMRTHLDAMAGVGPYDVQYRAVCADGATRILHARAELARDPRSGQAVSMVGTLLDVTERVAAEHELERHRDHLERLVEERTHELIAARDAAEHANRAKGDFLSSMSHELRTPMNAILGFSQLLQLNHALDTRSTGYVREILRAGHHLLELINEVLDLARIESGRLSLSPEPLPLDELVREAQTLVLPLALQREVTLGVVPPQGMVVRADRLRLKQVLLNLLSNAVKYNRPGGNVQVEMLLQDMFTVRIRVRDTGIGIAAENLTQLFQPFSRVSGTTAEGTGIGLSISQRLVLMMGGRIGVNSTPGVGSEFWVELPSDHLAELPPSCNTQDKPEATQAPRPGRQARVLYVEDNPANLKLVEQIVQRHANVELLMAPSGSLGLDLARSHGPDLLLLDIHLPDIDGYQVLEQLRADAQTRLIPVVAVTAQAMPEDVKRVMAAGFDGYLAKPLDLASFDALLQRMLQARPDAV